jgi:aminopeptidase-like protein
VDPTVDRDITRKVEKMQVLMDGTYSCFDIASMLDLDFYFVRNFCERIVELGLLAKKKRLPRDNDRGYII